MKELARLITSFGEFMILHCKKRSREDENTVFENATSYWPFETLIQNGRNLSVNLFFDTSVVLLKRIFLTVHRIVSRILKSANFCNWFHFSTLTPGFMLTSKGVGWVRVRVRRLGVMTGGRCTSLMVRVLRVVIDRRFIKWGCSKTWAKRVVTSNRSESWSNGSYKVQFPGR